MIKFVKQEDEHKWRCKIPECNKLFKEEHFWKKHVEKRHTDWLDSLKQEVSCDQCWPYLDVSAWRALTLWYSSSSSMRTCWILRTSHRRVLMQTPMATSRKRVAKGPRERRVVSTSRTSV